jgi:sugar phosphate isomerase/epimerase
MIHLGCATLCCDGFDDTDFKNSFELMPQLGFRYIEFDCWFPSNLTPASIRNLKSRCAETGLTPTAVYGSSFGGNAAKDVAHKIRTREAAVELGCDRIVAAAEKRGQSGGTEGVIDVLKEIAPAAEELDVKICLENHADNNMESAEDYQRIFEAVPSANVGVCIDTFIDTLSDRVNHIHLKDNAVPGVKKFTKFGEGTCDNHRIIRRLIDLGYNGFLIVELSPEAFGISMGSSDKFEEVFDKQALIDAKAMFEIYEKG